MNITNGDNMETGASLQIFWFILGVAGRLPHRVQHSIIADDKSRKEIASMLGMRHSELPTSHKSQGWQRQKVKPIPYKA